jgi:hypothetical protein
MINPVTSGARHPRVAERAGARPVWSAMGKETVQSPRDAEGLLRSGGWQPCREARGTETSLPGCSCWCIDREDPYAPDAFITRYGFALEVPHGDLCPPSVLRFPRYPTEASFAKAYQRMRQFVERSDFRISHSHDNANVSVL